MILDKSKLSEEDIKMKYITPAIQRAGWDIKKQVRAEYTFTDGRVIVRGNLTTRGKKKRADYLLFYKPNLPIAIIEAKENKKSVGAGMQQGIEYAEILDVPFVYSSNGDGFIEHDMMKGTERELSLEEFPSPEILWTRYKEAKNITDKEEKIITEPYFYAPGDKQPRYYQRNAINRTIEAIAKGQNRILLVMATGTGKTYTAFQIIYILWKSRQKKKILFIADRNILVDQTMQNDFKPFQKVMTKIENKTIDSSYEVYLALYQQLSGQEGEEIFKEFSPEFFDLIVIDEAMSSLAQEESRSISENVKWGHRKRFADGKVTVPFGNFLGYKRGEDGNLVIDEEQAVIVKRIYREYLSGSTAVAIAKGLTNDGIETPGHKQKWHASTVRSILTNEKYKGEALLQKYYTPDFLTKKQKINNGEVQQYYVENNHPAIIEPDTFEMVRLEMDRRLMLNGKYSGTDILTSRIKCGECGGSYGAKVWHSNDKYRKIMYQCNRKYSGKENCKTPAIRSDDIESRFVNVVNSMIENKDEIISNLERILDKICNKKGLSEEKEKLENSLAEQVEKIQELIEMNSRVAQNQEKYKKEYDAIIKTYDETKAKYEQLEIEISKQSAKHQMIKDYINTLKKQTRLLEKFDGLLWGSLLESATIKDKDTIVFKFKDGTEING